MGARMLISKYITSGLKILVDAVTKQPPLALRGHYSLLAVRKHKLFITRSDSLKQNVSILPNKGAFDRRH